MDVHEYLPFLAFSRCWAFLSTLVSEACACFTQAGRSDSERSACRYSCNHCVPEYRDLLVLAHNVVVIVAVDIIFWVWPGSRGSWRCRLWSRGVDGLAVTLLLGAFCARFRDIGPIVASVMMIAFFLTPVIW